MRRNLVIKARWRAALMVAGLAMTWGLAVGQTGATETVKPLALRDIMRELAVEVETMAGAMAREDFKSIERTARAIRVHREPPMTEKARIMTYIGARMGRFKHMDDEVKRAAADIGAAAGRGDGQGVIDGFQWLQSSCFGCHVEFRRDFQTHFYGKSQAMPKE